MKNTFIRRVASPAALVLAVTFFAGMVACHKDTDPPAEGPMQSAGRHVDNAASDAKDATKAAAERTSNDATDAKDTVKKKWNDAGL